MTSYHLTCDAENDLREVARYTLDTWGTDIFDQYRAGLSNTFAAIGNGTLISRQFSVRYAQLRVTKYRYHYVFFVKEDAAKAIIIGVIHEKRDIVSRLQERLSSKKKHKNKHIHKF
ncbi:MAG: hypothetical protein RL497_845 [Pseudomonadota bacterium]|jgi:toxin ParE1/3/4